MEFYNTLFSIIFHIVATIALGYTIYKWININLILPYTILRYLGNSPNKNDGNNREVIIARELKSNSEDVKKACQKLYRKGKINSPDRNSSNNFLDGNLWAIKE